jgi:hypothetical protein
VLEVGREDVGGVGEEVGAEDLGELAGAEVEQVLRELGLGVAPGEVGIRLAEPGLGERRHHRRAREGLREEDDVGVARLDLADQPLPEGDRLGVGVVDPEDADAVPDPEGDDGTQGVPELAPLVAFEVEVVDVLVALGRVLGVLQRAVGAVVEPLGVLAQPRVVG